MEEQAKELQLWGKGMERYGAAGWGDGRRGHAPRRVDDLQKLGQARQRFSQSLGWRSRQHLDLSPVRPTLDLYPTELTER